MLSQGPFTYNRFDVLAEKAKPDFLDLDKDKDKKESMEKAASDKKSKCDKCGNKDCGCDDKKSDKKDSKMPPWLKKEEVQEIEFSDAANFLIGEGICNDVDGAEMWLERADDDTLVMLGHQISENQVAANTASDHIKALSGNGPKTKPPTGRNKTQTMTKANGEPLFKPGENPFKKESIEKDDVLQYMMETNMVNNEVSAEALFNHISDEFLEEIEKDIMEGMNPKAMGKVAKMAAKMGSKKKGY